MGKLGRLALVLLLGTLVLGVAGVVVSRSLRPQSPSLLDHVRAFPPNLESLIRLLGVHAQHLEQIDPLDAPPVVQGLPQQRRLVLFDQQDQRNQDRAAWEAGPRGLDPAAWLEVSTFHRAAEAVARNNETVDNLFTLSRIAYDQRLAQGYSIPALVVRGAQPQFRGVITGRQPPPPALMPKQRRALKTVPIPPAAPLDPVYPFAVAAASAPSGLTGALLALSQYDHWSPETQIEVAYALGTLHWWSRQPNWELFLQYLNGTQAGEPILKLAALSGAVQGLNIWMQSGDPEARRIGEEFIRGWADTIESPWVDQAVLEFEDRAPAWPSELLLGRCPAYRGYIERLVPWEREGRPGQRFIFWSFMSQPGYAAYLAAERPQDWQQIMQRSGSYQPLEHRLLYLAWLEEVRRLPVGSQTWVEALTAALNAGQLEAQLVARGLSGSVRAAERRNGTWRDLLPAAGRHIQQLAVKDDAVEVKRTWPFHPSFTLGVCPVPGSGTGDDPEFLQAIDALLQQQWLTAGPALREAVVELHLPRLVAQSLPLTGWQRYAEEIQTIVGALPPGPERRELEALVGTWQPG